MPISYNATARYTKSKYNKIGKSPEEGFNCLSVCLDWYKNVLGGNFEFTDSIAGIDWNILVNEFHKNPHKIFNNVENELLKTFDIIPIKDIKKGDFVAFEDEKGILYPGVYAGNCQILTAYQNGVKVRHINSDRIIKAYRGKKLEDI